MPKLACLPASQHGGPKISEIPVGDGAKDDADIVPVTFRTEPVS